MNSGAKVCIYLHIRSNSSEKTSNFNAASHKKHSEGHFLRHLSQLFISKKFWKRCWKVWFFAKKVVYLQPETGGVRGLRVWNKEARKLRQRVSQEGRMKVGTPTMDDGSPSVYHCSTSLNDRSTPKNGSFLLCVGKNSFSLKDVFLYVLRALQVFDRSAAYNSAWID